MLQQSIKEELFIGKLNLHHHHHHYYYYCTDLIKYSLFYTKLHFVEIPYSIFISKKRGYHALSFLTLFPFDSILFLNHSTPTKFTKCTINTRGERIYLLLLNVFVWLKRILLHFTKKNENVKKVLRSQFRLFAVNALPIL